VIETSSLIYILLFHCQFLHTKKENTPPDSKMTPKHKVLHNEGTRSPLQGSRLNMKYSAIKKNLFSSGSPRVTGSAHLDGPKFQTLAPQTPSGPSFVRVQNSQVQISGCGSNCLCLEVSVVSCHGN
jgi:hypothetical protein